MGMHMEPLIDEMVHAWEEGVWTYGRATKTNFKMHVSTTKTLRHEEWRHIMLYVFTNLEEVTPYMQQFFHEFWHRSRDPTPQEYNTLLRKGAGNGLHDFIWWFKHKVRA
jgi:hypothetical protein